MSIQDEIQKALLEVESGLIGGVFAWKSASYPCVASAQVRSRNLDIGGWAGNAALTLVARASLFGGVYPKEKDRITYQDKAYTIQAVTLAVGEPLIKLVCTDPAVGV